MTGLDGDASDNLLDGRPTRNVIPTQVGIHASLSVRNVGWIPVDRARPRYVEQAVAGVDPVPSTG